MKYQKVFVVFWLSFCLLSAVPPAQGKYSVNSAARSFLADRYFRTELYFGMDKPGGGKVSAGDWDRFLETEVTPRFPDGFTVLEGYGQFKDSGGKIVREGSIVLIILYPKKQRAAVDLKIEELRESYKKRFNQESVLRVDFMKSINVKF